MTSGALLSFVETVSDDLPPFLDPARRRARAWLALGRGEALVTAKDGQPASDLSMAASSVVQYKQIIKLRGFESGRLWLRATRSVSYVNRHLSNRILNVFLDETRTSREYYACRGSYLSQSHSPNPDPNPTVQSQMVIVPRFDVEMTYTVICVADVRSMIYDTAVSGHAHVPIPQRPLFLNKKVFVPEG